MIKARSCAGCHYVPNPPTKEKAESCFINEIVAELFKCFLASKFFITLLNLLDVFLRDQVCFGLYFWSPKSPFNLGGFAAAMKRRDEVRGIISFSHFLPKMELNPEKRYLIPSSLAKAPCLEMLRTFKTLGCSVVLT